MAERREIWLDERDLVAGAQILSWIAFPHRPEHGISLLGQWFWARRRHRRDFMLPLPYRLKKKGVIESQLIQFEAKLEEAFLAGRWFDRQTARGPNVIDGPISRMFATSIHRLAAQRASAKGGDHKADGTGNATRDIWSRRKPVAHLASGVFWTLHEKLDKEGPESRCLDRVVFQPDWIVEALQDAEMRLRHAEIAGACDPSRFYRFLR